MNKKIIYIAGKITGDPDFQKKFEIAKVKLENLNYTVLNPAILPAGMGGGDYMRICLSMVDTAHTVYLLKDYKNSAGAQIELRYAEYIGKDIIFE